jgi:hypothetical protein
MSRYFLEMFYGFVLGRGVGIRQPFAFLMIPAAGFFPTAASSVNHRSNVELNGLHATLQSGCIFA